MVALDEGSAGDGGGITFRSDGMENLKPVKRDANGKVDNIQMLLSGLILYDAAQSQINK